ncbi:MAG: hypothetical protein EKK64_04735 [Neisseriaceae bacterium]|nr:MAG: hypothetical protein EKK64_04735 [Neisseriaceae bacterium]
MKKSDRTKLFSETFELNELIISIACILQANGYDVNVVDSNEDWLLHGLVSKEMYCEINGIAIKMTSSYAYTDNERGFLLMHYKKYIDKWTREVVVRKNVKDEKAEDVANHINTYIQEMIKRMKEYKRRSFTIVNDCEY